MRFVLLMVVLAVVAIAGTTTALLLPDDGDVALPVPYEPPPPKPAIAGVQIATRPNAAGIELALEIAIALQSETAPRTELTIRAHCRVAGESRDGYGWARVDRIPRGTSVVSTRVALREPRELIVRPDACELELFLTDATLRAHEPLGRYCWNGESVRSCPPPP